MPAFRPVQFLTDSVSPVNKREDAANRSDQQYLSQHSATGYRPKTVTQNGSEKSCLDGHHFHDVEGQHATAAHAFTYRELTDTVKWP